MEGLSGELWVFYPCLVIFGNFVFFCPVGNTFRIGKAKGTETG